MEDADSAAEAAQGALLHSGGLAQDFFAAMGGDSCAAERADVREALGPSPPLAKRSRGWRGTRLDDWEPMEDEHEPVEALAKAEADTEDEYQPFGEYEPGEGFAKAVPFGTGDELSLIHISEPTRLLSSGVCGVWL